MLYLVSLLSTALLVYASVYFASSRRSYSTDGGSKPSKRTLVLPMVASLALVTLVFSVRIVEAGSVAVVYQFGEIVDQREEGLNFIAPYQNVRYESVKVQRARFEGLTTFSSETQDVFIVATLNYSISTDAVQTLFREVGPSWFDILIEPRVNNFFKEEVVRYRTVEVAPNREAIRRSTRDKLAADLAQYSIRVDDLLIDNVTFSREFVESIEAKQIATQDALRELERVEAERNRAEQVVVAAEGDARATVIAAQARAEANRLLSESLTAEVLQYLAIMELAGNVEIALIPSGQGLILDPASLLGRSPSPGDPLKD